jgi:hypothetical protein
VHRAAEQADEVLQHLTGMQAIVHDYGVSKIIVHTYFTRISRMISAHSTIQASLLQGDVYTTTREPYSCSAIASRHTTRIQRSGLPPADRRASNATCRRPAGYFFDRHRQLSRQMKCKLNTY